MNDEFRQYIEMTAKDNWDDERGLAIPAEAWHGAWCIRSLFLKAGLSMPKIVPCGDGEIHFYFNEPKYDSVSLEYRGDNAYVEFDRVYNAENENITLKKAIQLILDWHEREKKR